MATRKEILNFMLSYGDYCSILFLSDVFQTSYDAMRRRLDRMAKSDIIVKDVDIDGTVTYIHPSLVIDQQLDLGDVDLEMIVNFARNTKHPFTKYVSEKLGGTAKGSGFDYQIKLFIDLLKEMGVLKL